MDSERSFKNKNLLVIVFEIIVIILGVGGITFATSKLLNDKTQTEVKAGEYNIDYVGDKEISFKEIEPMDDKLVNIDTKDNVIRIEFSLRGVSTNKDDKLIYDIMLNEMNIDCSLLNEYTKWIARYNDELNYDGEYGMWQYSATGNVLGIDTMVDLNYAYKDFPQIIEEGGYNNFSNTNLTRYKIGDEVEFHHVFLTSESTQPLMPYRHFGIITRIVQGARNPYLIGQDAGWVNDQVIERKIRYLSAPDYTGNSFTDALRSIQEDASFANRTKLAKLNGIDNYTGSQRQNDELLRLLKEGKLRT